MSIHKSFQRNFVVDAEHLKQLAEDLVDVLKPIPHKWATWRRTGALLVNSKEPLNDSEFISSVLKITTTDGVEHVRLSAYDEKVSSADYQTKDPIVSIDVDTTRYDRIAIEVGEIENNPGIEHGADKILSLWVDKVTSRLLTTHGLIDVTGWWRAHTLYLFVSILWCVGIQVVLQRFGGDVNLELHWIVSILLGLTLFAYLTAIHPAGQASFLWRSFFAWRDGKDALDRARNLQKRLFRAVVFLITIIVTLANLPWVTAVWNFLRGDS